jgi:polyphosphate kinase 2 (PPK2 family)
MPKSISLRRILEDKKAFKIGGDSDFKEEIEKLQLQMLRIQQGVWHKKSRAIIVFEGFDAAGKGGAIRKLTKMLDPRGFHAHPIGAPAAEEQGKHWLYRFWSLLPAPGTIAIFDRSWYGRVLVERVDGLTPKARWKMAYSEINQFEQILKNDGIEIVKIFLAITKGEQLRRFEGRLKDPYKQWKLSKEDIRARKKWNQHVEAVDEMFLHTNQKNSPWNLIPADQKSFARKETLRIVTSELKSCGTWMEKHASILGKRSLKETMRSIGGKKKDVWR